MSSNPKSTSLPVWSCNEWDPLKEIIIGTSIGANIPQNDLSHHATNYANLTPEEYANMPKGKYPLEVYEEAEEDLNSIVSILEQANIILYLIPYERHRLHYKHF